MGNFHSCLSIKIGFSRIQLPDRNKYQSKPRKDKVMKKVMNFALAGAMLGTAVLSSAVPAAAQQFRFGVSDDDYRWRDNDRRWDRHDRWDRDDRWDRHSRWDRDRRHYRDRDFDDGNAGALIFGLAAGAIAGAAASATYDDSYARCDAAYRSFDPETWTYLGYDGYHHRCPY